MEEKIKSFALAMFALSAYQEPKENHGEDRVQGSDEAEISLGSIGMSMGQTE